AIFALAEQVRSEALAALARRLPAGADVLVINPTPFGGRRLAFAPEASGVSFTLETSGQPLVSQAVDGGVLVDVPHVDAYGAITLSQAAEAAASPEDAEIGRASCRERAEVWRVGGLSKTEQWSVKAS